MMLLTDYYNVSDESNAYNTLFLLTGVTVATFALVKLAEENNDLKLESRMAHIIVGALKYLFQALHTTASDNLTMMLLTDYYNNVSDEPNTYNTLFLLTGVTVAPFVLVKLAEENNNLKLENRMAPIIAGALKFIFQALHTASDNLTMMLFTDFNNVSDEPNAYNTLFLLTGVAGAIFVLVKLAEENNDLKLESRMARIIAGALKFIFQALHTASDDLKLEINQGTILAAGPHRTGWDAIVLATKIKGTPPRFFATNVFNKIPGISQFMKMFDVITVDAHKTKNGNGRSANADAIEEAENVLKKDGCIGLFPQGGFSRIGQDPRMVYNGAAKLALSSQLPIHVVRLDGFWSLQNPIIPLSIRNNSYYRALFSAFHMNNVRASLCCVIDFHLKEVNQHLSDAEKIQEINAQLYAYYRHTGNLSAKQIDAIKTEIADNKHRLIWENKLKQTVLQTQLKKLKEEEITYLNPAMS